MTKSEKIWAVVLLLAVAVLCWGLAPLNRLRETLAG